MTTVILPREGFTVPAAMTGETIYVAPLSLVATTVAEARVSHLVTLINGETLIDTPPSIGPERHLKLAMNDICEPQEGLVLPSETHVADLVKFALAWDRKAPLLIHCWAGISRSTAAAFIALCALNPHVDELKVARALRRASPTAYPNRLLVALGDEALSRDGRMMAAVEDIGRGKIVGEADVFALPARLAA
ncbi:tyrosine protein phosphatase [Methyloceanibacter sp.]|uniref:tyrosine phosphatase family protein n=1 Tax=Methyloceanibacter sp. TaxID=1965321 RepID=UPI002D6FA4FE|nr:tyrosine protein phosphatase [Methyloceanibacter sp.]HZP09264.1 tyrosine protein phosphatase [Methyloceanibacter sp.]